MIEFIKPRLHSLLRLPVEFRNIFRIFLLKLWPLRRLVMLSSDFEMRFCRGLFRATFQSTKEVKLS